MKNVKTFVKNLVAPLSLSFAIALVALFSFGYGGEEAAPAQRRKLILQTVVKAVGQGHFSPREMNDAFSASIYDKVLNILDHDKRFFTQKDIDGLAQYRDKIDDELKGGTYEFFDAMDRAYENRINTVDSFDDALLSNPFAFTGDETVTLNGEKVGYAADEKSLAERWREYLKYRTLAKYVELKKDRDEPKKDAAAAPVEKKTDEQLEADARESIRKAQERYIKRLRNLDDEERFALYVNCITGSEDPHTNYFPPRDKQRFDESMKGSFFGIGAQLRDEEGKIKVTGIVPGSPSWKQGELKAGDEIVKVADGSAEPVDVQGYDLEDVVQMIRGKKGTEVRLTVKKASGGAQVIPIVRGEVMLEDTFAKSVIVDGGNGPVGYIFLPEFYADFQNPKGRHCAKDVAVEARKLIGAGVTGLIIDLRNNGGGSLVDAVEMTGLFIDEGPVVQVRNSNGAPSTLRDPDNGVLYDGPVAVMVNQHSASASEIMAAALQDYRRAIIVGSPTYGKGTVQKIVSLDDFLSSADRKAAKKSGAVTPEKPIGSLKLTVQKFYRVNGGSTQLRGVTPDIILPDLSQIVEFGERRDKAALKWDDIPPAGYEAGKYQIDVAQLAELSKKRVSSNHGFKLIEENAQRMKLLEEENRHSLNEASYRKELDDVGAVSKQLESLEAKTTPLSVTNPKEDMAKINIDEASVTKNNDWLKSLSKDMYLAETVNIVNDMNKLGKNGNSSPAKK